MGFGLCSYVKKVGGNRVFFLAPRAGAPTLLGVHTSTEGGIMRHAAFLFALWALVMAYAFVTAGSSLAQLGG